MIYGFIVGFSCSCFGGILYCGSFYCNISSSFFRFVAVRDGSIMTWYSLVLLRLSSLLYFLIDGSRAKNLLFAFRMAVYYVIFMGDLVIPKMSSFREENCLDFQRVGFNSSFC